MKKTAELIKAALEEDGWVGVDFDGTLSKYDEWEGPGVVGDKVAKIVDMVKELLKSGVTVKVFTARVADHSQEEEATEAIQDFCEKHIGRALDVTNEKDPSMIGLIDDKLITITVKPNTGEILESLRRRRKRK